MNLSSQMEILSKTFQNRAKKLKDEFSQYRIQEPTHDQIFQEKLKAFFNVLYEGGGGLLKVNIFYKYYFQKLSPVIFRNSRHFLNFYLMKCFLVCH